MRSWFYPETRVCQRFVRENKEVGQTIKLNIEQTNPCHWCKWLNAIKILREKTAIVELSSVQIHNDIDGPFRCEFTTPITSLFSTKSNYFHAFPALLPWTITRSSYWKTFKYQKTIFIYPKIAREDCHIRSRERPNLLSLIKYKKWENLITFLKVSHAGISIR